MKCSIASDYHIDINPWETVTYHLQNKEKSDVLILAGDTCQDNYKKRQMFFERMIYPYYDMILEVPGNHSHYNGDFNDVEYGCNKINNCHYMLNNGIKEIDGINFIGSTLWSNIPPSAEMDVGMGLNDYHVIKNFTTKKSTSEYLKAKEFLTHAMFMNKNNVVITHHLPFMSLIEDKYKRSNLNNAYASNFQNQYEENIINAKYWIHGHTHSSFEAEMYGCKFIRNPFGYYHHGEAAGFEIRIIDV